LAERKAENPATEQWMEEVCERENCKQALRRVKANKEGLVSPAEEGTPQGGPTTPRTQKITSVLNAY
jgi:hypothetical protein